jgi:hypothetical protein
MSSCDEDLLGWSGYSGDCGVPAGASYSASATPSPTTASAAAYPAAAPNPATTAASAASHSSPSGRVWAGLCIQHRNRPL